MKEIVNTTSRPIVLENGTILAAAGTEGSVKRVENISETELARLSGAIVLRDAEIEQPPSTPKARPEGENK